MRRCRPPAGQAGLGGAVRLEELSISVRARCTNRN